MEIILTEDVVGLGDIGETVRVRPGYARNFLIPRGFAIECGARSGKSIAHHMRQIEAKKRRLKAGAEQRAQSIRDLNLTFSLRVGSTGRVFGSVSPRDIAEQLIAQGFEIDRRRVLLTEPIKRTGTHFVKLKLHSDVTVQVKVSVLEVAASREEEEAAAKELKAKLESKVAERESESGAVQDESGENPAN